MKIILSKNKIYAITIVAILVATSATLIFAFWPFPITQWTFRGVVFNFREDLKSAATVPTSSADCTGIYDEFHNAFLRNVTIYVNQNTNAAAVANVEATEFAYKLTAYYSVEPIAGSVVPDLNGALFNSSTDTNSTLSNAKIFIITPPDSTNYGVYYTNYSVFVEGNSIQQLDLVTEKAMMCMFGMNLTYGIFSYSPAFQ